MNDNDGDVVSKVAHHRLRQRQEADQTLVLLSHDLLGEHMRIIVFQVSLAERVAQQVGGRVSIENVALLFVSSQFRFVLGNRLRDLTDVRKLLPKAVGGQHNERFFVRIAVCE